MAGITEFLDSLLKSQEDRVPITSFLDSLLKKPVENELKAPPRNPLVAPQADLAKKVKEYLNRYETKKLGKIDSPWNRFGAGHSIGDLILGQSPEMLDDVSYGLNPLTSGGHTGRIPIPDKRLLDAPLPIPGPGGVGVIKNKGGNWLTGSVENALSLLKRQGAPGDELYFDNLPPAQADREGALNSWIDTTLTKYVKNRMATPEDEVRKLADEGVLHNYPEEWLTPFGKSPEASKHVINYRKKLGFPEHGMAKTELGKAWEGTSDWLGLPDERSWYTGETYSVNDPKRNLRNIEENPWLLKLPPDAPVHSLDPGAGGGTLGFDHLVDELNNMLDPNSGLPMNLRLTPEGLKGLSMEEAVKKVHQTNQFRAEKAKKANERFAKAEGIPVYKDYGDGWKMLEYKLPDEVPEEIYKEFGVSTRPNTLDPTKTKYSYKDNTFDDEETLKEWLKKDKLESWLKQEGDTMGHCVGGYCDEVMSGRSRILSLRDNEGKSRATIELAPEQTETPNSYLYKNHQKIWREIYDKTWRKDLTETEVVNLRNELASQTPEWQEYMSQSPKFNINQIKGPGNRKPDKETMKYIQDFVKSGNWADVGDLENAGLYRYGDSYLSREDMLNDLGFKEWLSTQDYRVRELAGHKTLNLERDILELFNEYQRSLIGGGI